MKILIISDEECPALWDYFLPERLEGIELIISCGDLKADYLSFLVTMGRAPVLYVPGNHNKGYIHEPPEGCDSIDDQFVIYNGVRILGLGGCRKYHPGPYQYTEAQMRRRIRRLKYHLWRNKGVDIVVTHAAPEGLGDAEDPAHWGFKALRELLDEYHPQFLLHGHVHMTYGSNLPREIEYNGTRVINAYERYEIEIPDREVSTKEWNQLIFKTRPKRNIDDESL